MHFINKAWKQSIHEGRNTSISFVLLIKGILRIWAMGAQRLVLFFPVGRKLNWTELFEARKTPLLTYMEVTYGRVSEVDIWKTNSWESFN